MKLQYLLILSFLLLCFYSCSNILTKAYGIKEQKEFNLVKTNKFIKKNNISLKNSFYVKEEYMDYMINKYQEDSILRKQSIQALQVIYFVNDTLVSYHINCNTGVTLLNLKWDRNDDFKTFIPHKQAKTKIDTNFLFSDLKNHLKQTDEKQESIINSQAKVKIVVFWCFLIERQSKRLIKLVKKNLFLNKNEKIEIYFVNNDNLYIQHLTDFEN